MTLSLGVDTGGTYTDAVLIQDERTVLAKAKALTTRHDLAIGVGQSVRNVLATANVSPDQIGLASLSTTLATNALVEGQGGRVALIYIGFREKDLESHGLRDALKGDPALILSGGHDHAGHPRMALEIDALKDFLSSEDADVSGFAVAAQFAVRNPEHELRAMEMIRDITGKPVSASHQLSAKLGGPKRALTAVLNARLIGMIDRLITRAEDELKDIGILAPMMVVRGDGALISAEQARSAPIETILSGPAASIVGARWMTGADTALVSDIGGTTTDIALLRDGRPQIDPNGARVGPFRTMVEAVAMRTTGLGGDSEVHFLSEGLAGGVTLGPRRLLPISLVATTDPEIVHNALDAQLRSTTPGEYDGRFVRAVPNVARDGLGQREQTVLERIGETLHPLGNILKTRMELAALRRLVERGIVQISGLTPSDASHMLGRVDVWDTTAAEKALLLFGRRRTGSGDALSRDPTDMAQQIIDQMTHQTSLALLEAAFAEEPTFEGDPADLARHILMQSGLGGHKNIVRLETGVNVPVIGLGASAKSYYPAVAEQIGTEMVLPEHSDVANAIGAVVGQITMRRSGTVTAPSDGLYRAYMPNGPEDFDSPEKAMDALERALCDMVLDLAHQAGSQEPSLSKTRDVKTAHIESRDVFVEANLHVEATGRPRLVLDADL